jgi:hypothetical protein
MQQAVIVGIMLNMNETQLSQRVNDKVARRVEPDRLSAVSDDQGWDGNCRRL